MNLAHGAAAALTVILCALVVKRPGWRLSVLIGAAAAKDALLIVPGSVGVTGFHVVLALSAGIEAYDWLRGSRDADPGRFAVLLGVLPLAGLWSFMHTLEPAKTLLYTGRLTYLWLFATLVAVAVPTPHRRRVALTAFAVAGTALAVYALLQVATGGAVPGRFAPQILPSGIELIRPAVGYLDPNFLGGHVAAAALVALGLAAGSKTWVPRITWLTAASVCALATVATFSRSAWLGLAVGLVVLVAVTPGRPRLVVALALAPLVLALGIAVASPTGVRERLTTSGGVADASTRTRILMAQSAIAMARDWPVTGVGLEAFQTAYPAYRREGSLPHIRHPHQVPLALIAETGAAGLLAQLVLLGGLVLAARERIRVGWTGADGVIAAVMCALLVQALLQFYLYFEVLWFFAGLVGAGSLRRVTRAGD